MTNRKTTRRALVLSILSLLVCCSMLVGTTFAWFTDSVQTGNNKIVAGNLDVELYNDLQINEDKKVGVDTALFEEVKLWEPGVVAYENLTVANVGTLALKYELSVNFLNENDLNGNKLSQVLKVGLVKGGIEDNTTREKAVAAVKEWQPMVSFSWEGTLEAGKTAEPVALVIYWEPSAEDNKWNVNNGQKVSDFDATQKNELHIDLGIELYATQLMSEEDSFGKDYDEDAAFLPAWDGKETEVPAENNGVITISTTGELAAFAKSVNDGTSYNGKTIVLGADLNLADQPWTPIGACNSTAYFQGTFDGQGHTIYGLNVDNSADGYKYSTSGLFGWIDAAKATIKNVNISGATVKGSHWVGGLVGYMTGSVENCSVENSTIIGYNVNGDANGDKIGGLVGYMNSGAGKLVGNTVSDTTVTGYRDVAGLAGAVAVTNTVKNNTVKDSSVTYEADYGAAIVTAKTAVVVDESNTATNVLVVNGQQVENGIVKTGDRAYQVTSKEGLMKLSAFLPTLSPNEARIITVDLLVDVDLAGETWNPINSMWIVFNGNGHTIKNVNAAKADEVGRSGFWGYAGAVTINDLTLENVTSRGTQAGTFAGAAEGLKTNKCFLKGTNSVTWEQNASGYQETWSGIGAITGVLTTSTVNVEIAEGATVTLNYGAMTSDAPYVDTLTGYIQANSGAVTNKGTVAVAVIDSTSLVSAIKAAPAGETTTIVLATGTYAGDIEITVANLGKSGGDVIIKAADGATPVIAGTVTLGYRDQGVGATMYDANVTFEGITFDHAGAANHSLYVQDVKSLNLIDCTIIGDGEYGITSARGNGTGTSKIEGCTFKNAAMQLLGNFATGLVIDDCTFEDSRINVQAGNGVTVQGCVFNATITDANVDDSFYLIRSNSTPITVKDCKVTIDSTVTGVATNQAKWYLLANRGTTNWTVENVEITMTDAALAQTQLKVTACTSTGAINTTNLTVNGAVQ